MSTIRNQPCLQILLFLGLLLTLNSCFLSEIQYREFFRPVRRIFHKNRSYWTDRVELRGNTGTEWVYYKNGRPALQRYFNEDGMLQTITYLGRQGAPIRMDSLVYANGELIAGYYYSEPGHDLVLHFLNYKQQGQLSQRSWFGSAGELLSREFFLFDRRGSRRNRMIFDENDKLLYSETFNSETDELDQQNTYNLKGALIRQIRHESDQSTFQYDFNELDQVVQIAQLRSDGQPIWSSDLTYNRDGGLIRANFSTNGRFLFTYMGDLEFYRQSQRSWRHPDRPGKGAGTFKISHQDPFILEEIRNSQGLQIREYRLPVSRALFRRSTLDTNGQVLTDTLYASRPEPYPVSILTYDTTGRVWDEVTYDLDGKAKWRHTWYRDSDQRVIREELFALPNTFAAAVTRFYDAFNMPALSERFSAPDSFDGTWVFYQGGGLKKTFFYNDESELTDSWLFYQAGDTIRHSRFQTIDYFRVESKLGLLDTLLSQRRFTQNGILDWELFFDGQGQLIREVNRKKDGTTYQEVSYNPETLVIKKSTFAPISPDDISTSEELRGAIASQLITRLNSLGKTVQIISRNSSGEITWERRYAYRRGRLVKSAQLSSTGKPEVISTYTHNEQGQVLFETAHDSSGILVHTVENRYNEERQLVWKIFTSNLTGVISSNRFYYDAAGRIERNEIIESQRFIEAIQYEYFPEYYLRVATHFDAKGNLLRKEIENYFGENSFTLELIPKD